MAELENGSRGQLNKEEEGKEGAAMPGGCDIPTQSRREVPILGALPSLFSNTPSTPVYGIWSDSLILEAVKILLAQWFLGTKIPGNTMQPLLAVLGRQLDTSLSPPVLCSSLRD